MKANSKRHIRTTKSFDHLIPKSVQKDTIIVGSDKAKLEDTLQLMQLILRETLQDTQKLAVKLKGHNLSDTCKNIWNFVYQHIQYKMDKTGVEQVRRPSRTWADRMTGVDCDCYTVFIGSILTNLGIPFKMRITKYGGKHHFQHVYPIVPTPNGHIVIDCVADQFNYEVPYSEKQDIEAGGSFSINGLGTLSGVDMADISLDALEESPIPLRKIIHHKRMIQNSSIPIQETKQRVQNKKGQVLSPFRLDDGKQIKTISPKKDFNLLNFLILSGISVAAGIGVLKLLTGSAKSKTGGARNKTPNANKKKQNKNIKRSLT
ncbi:transglutaminase-like domain-containing protein [uncultured Aquimarina sp.]|uniref:transglutaminase-like domain-containing protein n=1 Tax=uncultured Aquimarina sp. TaxID=575652 RepID=UPI0026068EB8|nr:transglutaminase-like domain-containing protein [uncultured Aquimarina sp.]